MSIPDPPWLTKLMSRGFRLDATDDVTVTVDASRDNSAMVAFISRFPGLYDALRSRQTSDTPDPLASEDPDDLYYLLLHLHEAVMLLRGQEERVMLACRDAGVPMETMATALGLKRRQNVDYHLKRIDKAAQRGRTAASLEHEGDA